MPLFHGPGLTREEMLASTEVVRKALVRPWYERAPWSWLIGFVFGIAGAGVVYWLGWN